MEHSIALVTGATSGVGYAAARTLAGEGWREIIITGRSLAEAKEAAAKLAAETKTQVFTPLELELDTLSSVQSVLAELVKRGRPIDLLLLNAGIMGRKELELTAAGIEMSAAPLIGHHQLTVGLLRANLLSPDARIVIASSEAARGDVPLFSYTDVPALAATHYHGDRTAAVEALLHSGPNVKYQPNRAFADAKLIVAWWAAALARRLPTGMAVYAVSPGAAPSTNAVRNAGSLTKWLLIPLTKLIPGMSHTPEMAARRYLQASDVRNRRLGPVLRLAAQEVHRPNRGDAPPTLSRSRQPGSRVAGRRQGLRRRLVLPSILERGVLKRSGRG